MDLHDTVFQDSCFETRIHREETEDLQIGVKAIIVISITIVIIVLIYNVAYQVNRVFQYKYYRMVQSKEASVED